jgi:hypothetical protein
LVGEASARVIEDTVGAVLSIAYVCPLNGIGGPNAFPARSLIPVPFWSFNCNVPLPLPVFAETVHVLVGALPLMVIPPAPATPPPIASWKFPAVTPVTSSENFTVHDTEAALVGLVLAVLIDSVLGAV